VIAANEGKLSIRTERIGLDVGIDVQIDGFFRTLLARGLCFPIRRSHWRLAGFEEPRILPLAVRWEPVDVRELRQEAFDWGYVEPLGNYTTLLVVRIAKAESVGFQLGPIRTEGVRRHA